MSLVKARQTRDYEVEDGGQQKPPKMLCRGCLILTEHADLATYGAWCKPCYDDYCRHPPQKPRRPDSPTVADMKTRLTGRLSGVRL